MCRINGMYRSDPVFLIIFYIKLIHPNDHLLRAHIYTIYTRTSKKIAYTKLLKKDWYRIS